MAIYEIELDNTDTTFRLDLGGQTFQARKVWNPASALWELSLYDPVTLAPLALGVPLVTGVDLLGLFYDLGLSGILYVVADGGSMLQEPGAGSWGDTHRLVYEVE